MAISSIHIENGKRSYFFHNSREHETKNSIFNDEENYCSSDAKTALKIFDDLVKKRKEKYEQTTNQKFQNRTVTHLSAILNFNAEHTPEDIQKVCTFIENRYDTKILQFAMHRDEGHTIEDESEQIHSKIDIKNYHAHIEMLGLDSNGKSIKQKLDKAELKKLQTEVAKLLKMERGQESGYTKEQYKKIQEQLQPVASYATKSEYNKAFNQVAKQLGYTKKRKKPKKRLDTYEFKEYAEQKAQLEKELKTEIAQLRAELKENKATRQEYAQLEQLNRDLKEQLNSKDITITELKELIKMERDTFLFESKQKDREIGELKAELKREKISEYDLGNKTLTKDELIDYLFAENDKKDREIGELKTKLADLQKKNSMYLGMNKDLKDEISSLKTLINERETQNNEYEGIDAVNSFLADREPSPALQEIMDKFGTNDEEEKHKITYLDR